MSAENPKPSSRPISFSFELFPPRTPEGVAKLPATIRRLAVLRPDFFSVTYGAGGSDQNGTYETLVSVVSETGIEAAPHLTCVGSSRERIAELLQSYRDAGVKRIVALRGDLPATAVSSEAPGDFHYANELITFIRETHGDAFKLEVAAYPETHPQAVDPQADFDNFRRKVDAGADGAVTQYFYNADAYFEFLNRCHIAGIRIPIIAGVMPITNYTQLMRFSAACGAEIPRWIRLRLESLQNDRAALIEFGLEVVSELCKRLLRDGAPGLHLYTLNQADTALRLWQNLDLPRASA
jgi:methylenetetrahydrofolate reductase (NADPH)